MSVKQNIKKLKENNKVIKSICNFLNKDNYMWVKLVIAAVLAVIGSIIFEYTIYRAIDPQYISNNRMMLVSMIFMFIELHFIFKLDKMYDFIHKYRYALAAAFLIFAMIMGYHGSSIVNFDNEVQSNSENRRFHTLLGFPRLIRTDEWASSMLYKLSQGVGNEDDRFLYFNDRLRGTETDMFTLVDAPVKSILMIGKPLQLGFLFFGNDAGISFYWYGKLVLMLLGSYEICRIITKDKRKVSLVGMIAITFSAATQWWYCMDTLIWGQLIIVLVNKFMITNKKYVKYLCALGLVSVLLAYAFVLYPAWQVPFVYVLFALFIFMFVTNIKNGYRFTIHDVIVITLTVLTVLVFVTAWFVTSKDAIEATMSTDYPGQRREVGGGSFILYSYIYNIFYPYKDAFNPCETSSMLSFYPIPMIFGILYLFRNRKDEKIKDDLLFLIPAIFIGVFLTVWCKYGFLEIIAKLSLMSMSTSQRASIALGTINIYILMYLFGRMEDRKEDGVNKTKDLKNILNVFVKLVIAVLFTVYALYIARKHLVTFLPPMDAYLGKIKILISGILFGITFISIFNMDRKCFRNIAYIMIVIIALVGGITVNPVSRTTDVIYEKPISKKFAEIKDKDPDAIWLGDDTGWYLNNYMVANGLRVINSSNVYPNFELFETILGEERAKEADNRTIFNRYCHVNINLGKYEEDRVFAAAADNLVIELNTESLEKLDVDYIVAKKDLNSLGYDMKFEELYKEDGLYIFKPIY